MEGESDDPADNRFIGVLKITGADFDDGVIPAGADLQCEFEILDSGKIVLEVPVPDIRGTFHSGRNFYSPQEGKLDFSTEAARVSEEGDRTLQRLDEIDKVVDDPKLEQARRKLGSASSLDPNEPDTERTQEAMESVFEARRLLAQVRKENLKEIRQLELDSATEFFNEHLERTESHPAAFRTASLRVQQVRNALLRATGLRTASSPNSAGLENIPRNAEGAGNGLEGLDITPECLGLADSANGISAGT